MIRNLLGACLVAMLAIASPAQAAIKVLATTADWGALTTELGGDKVNVYTATNALQDVHQVDAKPSLVARARTADLVVANGAELEIGWLPVLLQESGNPKIQPGTPGYFEATSAVRLMDIPTSVDRSMGDIHALGNPHIQLDPRNIAAVAKALTARLASLDAANAEYYHARGADFQARWQQAMARWEAAAAPLKGASVVVIHVDQRYLCRWLGLNQVAAIEPKPGVPPSAGYLADLVTKLSANRPQMILRNAYNDPEGRGLALAEGRRAGRDAAVLGGRDAGSEGPVRSLRRHHPATAGGPRNERHPRGPGHTLAGADRRRPRIRVARAARPAGAAARHRVHRPRDRAGGRARRDRRPVCGPGAPRLDDADRCGRRGAARCDAAHVDGAQTAGGAGSPDRRAVRPRVHRADPAAREQSARWRAVEGPAGGPDPLGVHGAAGARRDPDSAVRRRCGSAGANASGMRAST